MGNRDKNEYSLINKKCSLSREVDIGEGGLRFVQEKSGRFKIICFSVFLVDWVQCEHMYVCIEIYS